MLLYVVRLLTHTHRLQTGRIFSTTTRVNIWRIETPQPPSIHAHGSHATSLPLPEQLRTLMRLMSHSVVVCTSSLPSFASVYQKDASDPPAPSPVQDHAVPRAMTMSSFTSLALSPVPIVTFNVALPSRTLDAISASGRFNIHILSGDGPGAAVADRFAKGNQEKDIGPALDSDDTCEVMWDSQTQDPPILDGQGILYIIRCRLLVDRDYSSSSIERRQAFVQVKNHVIVLGEVLDILEGKGRDEQIGRAHV